MASSGASSSDDFGQAACDLIYSMLHILLLRAHTHLKNFRLSITGLMRAAGIVRPPMTLPILQPVIDLLQYQVFCNRVKQELDNSVSALHKVGVPAKLRFDSVGESGSDVTKLLMEDIRGKIGGEAVLRIDDRYENFHSTCGCDEFLTLLSVNSFCSTDIPSVSLYSRHAC